MPVLLAVLAEVGAPRPAHDHDVDRVRPRVDAELAVAVEGDRAEVATRRSPLTAISSKQRGAELVDRVRELHVEELRRVVEALEVVVQPEDGGAALGVVAADALEDAGAVVQAVRADVDPGVRPVHELAVHPDLLGLLHRPLRSLIDAATSDRLAARDADELGRRARPAMCRSMPAPTQTQPLREQAPVDQTRDRRARSANGETPPGAKPVASSTCAAAGDLRLRGAGHAGDLRRVGAAVARDEHEHGAAVAVEDERLDDLAQLAADRRGGVLGGRRARRRTPRRAPPHRPHGARRSTRSTGSGHVADASTGQA